jgi:CTP:molybdopterin cytidylyltransferase MocA/uncharacterized damage-inducible protein DinB
VAAVLLAAGGSKRLGSPKQLLRDAHGETLVHRSARLLAEAGCAPVLVVVGSSADLVSSAIEDLKVDIILNDDWPNGMGTSVATGAAFAATRAPTADGLLIATCDMPGVDVAHISALIRTSLNGTIRTASTYKNANSIDISGIPAIFPRSDWPHLMELEGDQGARVLLRSELPATVPLNEGLFDLDTPEDVARWRASSSFPASPSPAMSTLSTMVLADLDAEFANTRRMLERIPADRLDFAPHEKSWSLGKLANHVCDFPLWGTITLTSTGLNFDEPMPPSPVPTQPEEFLARWDERVTAFTGLLAKATDDDLHVIWTATAGGHPVISMSRIAVLRGMVMNHMIHHRAQLSVYYRLTGVPVPGLYGPSADEG